MQRAPLSMASRSAVKAEAWLEEQAQDTEHRRNPHHHHHSNHHHHGRSQLHTHNHTLHSRSGHTPRFADEDEDADADMMGSLLRGKLTETSAYSSWADGAVHEAQTAVARAHLDNLCGVCGAARPEDPQAPFCSVCGSQLPPLPLFLKDDAAKLAAEACCSVLLRLREQSSRQVLGAAARPEPHGSAPQPPSSWRHAPHRATPRTARQFPPVPSALTQRPSRTAYAVTHGLAASFLVSRRALGWHEPHSFPRNQHDPKALAQNMHQMWL
eukprot:m.318927 g.318927  ORF g.318927 m.318927 type:complete len:269 (+) comp23086_c2_seq51:455-1261(+)